tara:strand:+ start:10229 stop:10900 length:672 start_codon:yes stop_codon:yes gene_type:complete
MAVVHASRDTCPTNCPLKGEGGCYGENFPMKLHWDRLDNGAGVSWYEMLEEVRSLPDNELWRYGVVGDLPKYRTDSYFIDTTKLIELIDANRGKRGFAYTHHVNVDDFGISGFKGNAPEIKYATQEGFTINCSANTLDDALEFFNDGLPTVTLLHESRTKNFEVDGRRVNICPKFQRKDVTCKSCGLCQWADRDYIIGFPAHGTRKGKVNEVALSGVLNKLED